MFTPREREILDAARERLESAFDYAMVEFADELITLVSIEEINEFAKAALENVLRTEDDFVPYEPNESMDGDHASALASAGWGTDEDYGHFAEPLEDDRFETAEFYTGGDE